MTVGMRNRCAYCKRKLFGCKLKDTAHIHAEINGTEIVAKIHPNDTLMKFLQKLESTPYEPSMKSLERECEDGLCREKSFYDIRDSTRKSTCGWSSRCKKCQSCTSWFRKRIGSPRKRAAFKVDEHSRHSIQSPGTPTEKKKYPLVRHKDGTKRKAAYDDDTTTPYTSLRSSSASSGQSAGSGKGKKSRKPKRKCKLFKSKRKKDKASERDSTEEEYTEGNTSGESKKRRKSSQRSRRKSKSKQKRGKTPERSSSNSEGDTSVKSKKLRKSSKRSRRISKSKQKKNKTVGRTSTEEENTERDSYVESKKLKKFSKRNRGKSKNKQDKKCQTSILYPSQGGETKAYNESINYARLISWNRYQNYQIPKNPLITLPVLVNLKHLFYGKKYTTEKKHAVT